jgi:hypothetical protein
MDCIRPKVDRTERSQTGRPLDISNEVGSNLGSRESTYEGMMLLHKGRNVRSVGIGNFVENT